jgi:hypothetical protein
MSLGAIAALVEELEIPLHRDALQAAFDVRDQLDARIAVAVADFETAGLYELDGSVTMRSWLRQHTRCDQTSAAKVTSTGRKLAALPLLRDAVLEGRLSGGQLDIILANIAQRHVERFAAHEGGLVPHLEPLTVEQTRVVMEDWKRHADALDPGSAPADPHDEVYLSRTLEGRGDLSGNLSPDLTALVQTALRVADPKDFDLSLAQRRAEALGQVCQHFLDHQQTRKGGRHRPHLNVAISLDDVTAGVGGSYSDTGELVSPVALAVLKCDAAYHRLLFSAVSGVLDYGRSTRDWPVDVYNAIALRDAGCRIGACEAPPSWCDVHHVVPWEHGGDTSVTNGAMACRRHHRLIHTPGHTVKLLPDGRVELTHPDGRVDVSQPRGPVPQHLWRQPAGS